MRLVTPHPNCRFVVGGSEVRAVVAGVFPPEEAPSWRERMAPMAAVMTANLATIEREIQHVLTDILYYGGPR